MDAFYASVEQRDHPEWKGLPVVVGGSPEGRGGVVATASYEARKFGVRSAMPSKRALQLCPDAIFVLPRFSAYRDVSRSIREIFRRYTDIIEPLSLDEAYLDVTQDRLGIGSAIEIANQIRSAIRDELLLTASAGVSINKFVAKIASDMNKPDGITFIGPSAVESFIEQLPVEKFYGVGHVTAAKMKAMGLHKGADLKALTEAEMIRSFGKTGRFYYRIVRGIDDRPVETDQETKSLGAEDTFPEDRTTHNDMINELYRISRTVAERLKRYSLKGRTVTVKVKFSDFRQITRSRSLQQPIADEETIAAVASELLCGAVREGERVRLLGISLSNFQSGAPPLSNVNGQLELF
ncbi:MAG: DNA polymerase IV [Sphingobacteriales bacterium]|nr:MAG: DNA polymerase IV [Sphingobacteriales bacterium]